MQTFSFRYLVLFICDKCKTIFLSRKQKDRFFRIFVENCSNLILKTNAISKIAFRLPLLFSFHSVDRNTRK